jgi:N-acetylmuramoyl-L-alanine amidase
MTFNRDPVVSPGSQSITFDNQIITHANYSENNGDAELEVDATAPLMAAYSSDQRTITLTSVQAPAAASSGQHPTPPPAVALSPSDNKAAHATTSSGPNRILAVVDPAHGGDERGAALSDKIAEKDVTLGFARLLRHELETRGFAVNLLRNGDNSLTLDQRAEAANVAGAGIYISVHAISEGNGARVYTALLPAEGESKGVFHAWNSAQSPVLQVSRIVSAAVVAELQKQQLSAQERPASLRPLNNVVVPAIAVELAPGPDGINDLISANYQQRVAAAIADGVASVRGQLQVQP